MKKLNLAVIGKDVSKSSSPAMHKFIAEHMGNFVSYANISVPVQEFDPEEMFEKYDGFNVTIPYKLSIIPYLNKLCGDAETFGAVNTVLASAREGYNTDGLGFMLMLKLEGVETQGKRILLLGAGGAGRSVAKKLKDEGAQVFVYDKIYENALKIAEEFEVEAVRQLRPGHYFAVINATGIGMHLTEGISPVDGEILSGCDVAVDLIYTPAKSAFLEIAESLGKHIINGEAMLFYQAYFAECIFFGVQPDSGQAKELFDKFRGINI